MAEHSGQPALTIEDLHVYYGESHAIQGVSMALDHGILAVVGRNGMGKSTLCNTIAGLKSSRSGSIRILGRETSRLEPHVIHRHGVGYVPQGRRVWPSLSVDEHLRLVATGGGGIQHAAGQPRIAEADDARMGREKLSGGREVVEVHQPKVIDGECLGGELTRPTERMALGDDARADLRRSFAGLVARNFAELHLRHFDMQINTVEQRTGNALAISLNLDGAAAALAFQIAKISARTRIHRGDEHEFRWKCESAGRA